MRRDRNLPARDAGRPLARLAAAVLLAALGLAGAAGAWAQQAQPTLPAQSTPPTLPAQPTAEDPAIERRVAAIAEELRCLVCQNQTIADSNADLAVDLKRQIREQLRAGRSDKEIVDFMVQRYGDFVLYRPPLKSTTAALWFGPLAFGIVGVVTVVVLVRRRRREAAPQALTDAERRQAAELLDGADSGGEGAR